MDSSQLFYGSASIFAFLQHTHRAIYNRETPNSSGHPPTEESLDIFMKRSVFFGIPSKVHDVPSRDTMQEIIPRLEAMKLLDVFKASSLFLFPFLTPATLDEILTSAYTHPYQPQATVLLLAILAVGSLSTPQTEQAERLFQHAKRQAAAYEDTVTISMIHVSLLMAEYQISMGRPNAAYLYAGASCRKSYALGLHKPSSALSLEAEDVQTRHATLWAVYIYDNWISFTLGRPNTMRKSDITCPYPDNQPLLVDQSIIADAVEKATAFLYDNRSDSLLQLYNMVQDIHHRLLQNCKRLCPETLTTALQGSQDEMLGQVSLHNMYYHFCLTIYRPFLVADSSFRCANKTDQTEMLWLQQACRQATGAAEDCIALMRHISLIIDAKDIRRYNAFYVETSCAVLLYDSLNHPLKHASNMELVNLALNYMQSMVNDEPISSATRSIKRIMSAVDHSLKDYHAPIQNASLINPALPPMGETMGATRNDPVSSTTATEPNMVGFDDLLQYPEVNLDALTADLFDFIPIDKSTFFGY
ncbi:hypothetical protein CEP54_014960 [Fusarium duplospermum]|uniref:Xylanolytic transcriptional activator regulatory domain-containing protein n=1 Tax=Fusarium duplospermum TaxID=1325734 RepID=A0A428NSP2_9HYPO|nr:hypothetical protein CEP54_014960 [Fusarium duplospermum]